MADDQLSGRELDLGCSQFLVALILMALIFFIAFKIMGEVRDLQHRVGVLETNSK